MKASSVFIHARRTNWRIASILLHHDVSSVCPGSRRIRCTSALWLLLLGMQRRAMRCIHTLRSGGAHSSLGTCWLMDLVGSAALSPPAHLHLARLHIIFVIFFFFFFFSILRLPFVSWEQREALLIVFYCDDFFSFNSSVSFFLSFFSFLSVFIFYYHKERRSWKKPRRNQNATGRLLCALRCNKQQRALPSHTQKHLHTHTHTHTGYIIIIAVITTAPGQGGSNIVYMLYFFYFYFPPLLSLSLSIQRERRRPRRWW